MCIRDSHISNWNVVLLHLTTHSARSNGFECACSGVTHKQGPHLRVAFRVDVITCSHLILQVIEELYHLRHDQGEFKFNGISRCLNADLLHL